MNPRKKHLAMRIAALGVRTACGSWHLDPARYTWVPGECTCGLCIRARGLRAPKSLRTSQQFEN